MTGRKRSARARRRPVSGDMGAKLDTALAVLTRNDIMALSTYASRRLEKVGLPSHLGEDMVQRAILQVAIGDRMPTRGRHPRMADLVGADAFLKYLYGVINSLVDTQRASLEQQFVHAECHHGMLTGATDGDPKSGVNVYGEVAFRDLVRELACQLHRRAPARLHSLIRLWREQEFDCDRIPLDGHHRRLRAELRDLAADALRHLMSSKAHEIQRQNQHGANLL